MTIEEVFEQFLDSQLSVKLGADYKKFRDYIIGVNKKNREIAQLLEEQRTKISALEKVITALSSRIEKLERAEKAAQQPEADGVIAKFNAWAANPAAPLPQTAFTCLGGEFRIRTNQQIVPVPDETRWITNRTGTKRYLFPNPNTFNQMTNILELYEMDQNMLNGKGKNKIKIIVPCELSSSGFIEFPGKLQILP